MIRILNTPRCSAAFNMAVDEALFNARGRDPGLMTLRIYSWNPPAVSLGYGQEVEGEIDPGQCDRYGIELVRRITGGRAVLHDQELTYSLIASEFPPGVGKLLRRDDPQGERSADRCDATLRNPG